MTLILVPSYNAAAQAERELSATIEPQADCTLSVTLATGAVDWGMIDPSLSVTKRYPESGYTSVTVTKTNCDSSYQWRLTLSNDGSGFMRDTSQNLALAEAMKITYKGTSGGRKDNVPLSSSPIDFGTSNSNSYLFNEIAYAQSFAANANQVGSYKLTLTYTVSPVSV